MAVAYVCDRCENWSLETGSLTEVTIPSEGATPSKKISICKRCIRGLLEWAKPIPKVGDGPRLQEAKKL
ncbi:MAG: hypothetical protein ACHQX3_00725 [Nitrospirales bacterium]